jgi:hypothetical protein
LVRICGSAANQFSSMIFDSAVVYVASRFQLLPQNFVLVRIWGYPANQFSSIISDSAVIFVA